jgi:hypothetical protein
MAYVLSFGAISRVTVLSEARPWRSESTDWYPLEIGTSTIHGDRRRQDDIC